MSDHRYATFDNMQERFGYEKLLQMCGVDAENIDEDNVLTAHYLVVDAALDDATELIDSYVASRYAVPLEPIPAPIRRYCADIALWYLDRARTDEAHRQGYEDALAGLQLIAKGLVGLQCAGVQSQESATSTTEVLSSDGRRMFSAHSLKGL